MVVRSRVLAWDGGEESSSNNGNKQEFGSYQREHLTTLIEPYMHRLYTHMCTTWELSLYKGSIQILMTRFERGKCMEAVVN